VNPRTANRALPRGDLSVGFVAASVLVSCAGFVATAAWIHQTALAYSPIVLGVLLGYSLTKRFTWLCHVVLGAALGLAPVGAWVAVRGEVALAPVVLGVAVLLWTTGFDILYACLDVDFDRQQGLHSVPVKLGVPMALRVAAGLHAAMLGALVAFGIATELGWVFFGAVGLVLGLLVYEHSIVSPRDLSRVNRAFFTMNGIISFLLMTAMLLEVLVG